VGNKGEVGDGDIVEVMGDKVEVVGDKVEVGDGDVVQ
jgi:hypothetical protein